MTKDYESKRKIAHNIAQRFREEERWSKDLNEDTQDYLEVYEIAAGSYMLDSVQHLRYMQNLFDGEAKWF